jgi:hypothetical protein
MTVTVFMVREGTSWFLVLTGSRRRSRFNAQWLGASSRIASRLIDCSSIDGVGRRQGGLRWLDGSRRRRRGRKLRAPVNRRRSTRIRVHLALAVVPAVMGASTHGRIDGTAASR